MELHSDISVLKGVGPKTKEMLNQCGLYTILDLILYFPREYERITRQMDIKQAQENEKVILEVKVSKIEGDLRTKDGKIITTIIFTDGESCLKGKWFNQKYIKNNFKISNTYTIMGKVQCYKGERTMTNPAIVTFSKEQNKKIISKYSLKANLSNVLIFKLICQVLASMTIKEVFPSWIIEKYKFCSLDKAIRNIHIPSQYEELLEAKRRLKFQELFSYSLKILMLRQHLNKNKQGIPFKISEEMKVLKESLPFQLTKAQSKVVREILLDEKKGTGMNRLVQGDVGSGKTIVAIIAMFNVVKNGFQATLMAPTEILGKQHFEEIEKILQGFNVSVKLLSGSLSKKEKDLIKEELAQGKIDILVGTHALLEENVLFQNLGMVVTDEQHRFGVMQRNTLYNKGKSVDVLVMTATPIPRTLALYLYGDLDISIIDELPPGRQKISTFHIKESGKSKAYEFAVKEIKEGRQVYIVCPLIEENEELTLTSVEKLFFELKEQYFMNVEVEMLHGKMTPKEKNEVMSRFKNAQTKVLIATTVIEVGVNVPNATVMIIENAERFGLAQLHQLRGRIGRGIYKSACILIANVKNENVKKRMEIMEKSNDGFLIAEEDLKIRGSGELFGVRQHGEAGLILADLIEDFELFKIANEEAKKIMESTKEEDINIKNEILKNLQTSLNYICLN